MSFTARMIAPAAASVFLLAACAPPPSPDAGLSADSRGSLAGRTLIGKTEPGPAMQRRAYQGGAAYGGGGLIGALVSVAVVAAINAAEAAATGVDIMPAPSVDLADHAERTLIASLAGSLDARDGMASGAEIASGEDVAATDEEPVAPSAAPSVIVNVVSNGHVLQSTGVATGETFIYAGAMSATMTDEATGRLYGKGVCTWRRDLPGREGFLLLAAAHHGVDTTDAEARIADRKQARADAMNAEKGASGVPVEINPMEGVLTKEQEVDYMDSLAKQDAENCAGQLLNKLLNSPPAS